MRRLVNPGIQAVQPDFTQNDVLEELVFDKQTSLQAWSEKWDASLSLEPIADDEGAVRVKVCRGDREAILFGSRSVYDLDAAIRLGGASDAQQGDPAELILTVEMFMLVGLALGLAASTKRKSFANQDNAARLKSTLQDKQCLMELSAALVNRGVLPGLHDAIDDALASNPEGGWEAEPKRRPTEAAQRIVWNSLTEAEHGEDVRFDKCFVCGSTFLESDLPDVWYFPDLTNEENHAHIEILRNEKDIDLSADDFRCCSSCKERIDDLLGGTTTEGDGEYS